MSQSQSQTAGRRWVIVKMDCEGRLSIGPETAAERPKAVPGITVSRTWSLVKRNRVSRWYGKPSFTGDKNHIIGRYESATS
jgi:hypothetical protein